MLLFYAKTVVKESRKFELARLKKKNKKKKKKKKRKKKKKKKKKKRKKKKKKKKKKRKKKEEKKKGKHFGGLATFWFGTFAMLFSATGCVIHHENTRR